MRELSKPHPVGSCITAVARKGVEFAGLLGSSVSALLLTMAAPRDGHAQPAVTAAPPSVIVASHSASLNATFTVKNNGAGNSGLITLTCGNTGSATCLSITPSGSPGLGAGGQFSVTVNYSVANPVASSITLFATSVSSGSGQGAQAITVQAPAGAPVVDVTPYVADVQALDRCEAACFTAVHAQTSVPHFSLDAPRSITLVYHGDRVAPKAFVHVNVQPDQTFGTLPSEYQLQVKINGALVTFTNGDQTLRFSYPAVNGTQAHRIGGQFDASSYPYGVVQPMEILVSSKIGATLYTYRWLTSFLGVNEAGSAVARGWTIAGVQRLFIQPDNAGLVIDGTGSATRFPRAGSVWTRPPGEFSDLRANGSGYLRAYPDSTKVFFNQFGYMTSVADRFGNATSIQYDANNRVYRYDANNRVYRVTDPAGKVTTLLYNANGLATITDGGGRITLVQVQANRTLTAFGDPDGVGTAFGYDASLRLSTITDRASATTTFGYDATSNKIVTVTAPAVPIFGAGTISPVVTFSPWQLKGVPTTSTSGTPLAPPRADTVYGRVQDPESNTTRFTVDRWGQAMRTVLPTNDSTVIVRNANGLPTSIARPGYPAGTTDTYSWNADGLSTGGTPAGGTATTIVYGAWGQPTNISGPNQSTTGYVLGVNGRVDQVQVGSPLATIQTLGYDSRGRVTSVTDGNGNVTSRAAYSASGFQNTDSVWTNAGAVTQYTYDAYGRVVRTVTPLGTDSTWYRLDNRVDSASTRLTPTVRRRVAYTYNNLYLTQVKDPLNQVWQFGYNALGWVTSRTDPALAAETYQYDRDGRVRQRTNRRGQAIAFAYDAIGRPTSQSGTNAYAWSYFNGGRLVVGTSPFTLDSTTTTLLGAPDSAITRFLTASSQRYGRNYAYTSSGTLDSLRFTTPGNALRSRKWILNAAKGTLDSLRFGAYTTSLARDANLDVTAQLLPKGDGRTFSLGAVRAVLQQSVSNAPTAYSNTVNRWAERDNLGRLTRLIEYNGVTQRARDFGIDGFQQLSGTTYLFSPSAPSTSCGNSQLFGPGSCPPGSPWTTDSTRAYTYDAVGNRTDLGGTYTNNRISAFNGCSYSTDADGNVTSRTCGTTTTTFVWSAEGTLDSVRVAVSGGSTTGVKFGYDASGHLVFRRVNGTPQSHFLWERDDLAAELGGTATTTTTEHAYLGTDQPYATAVGSQVYFAQTDPLGNVVALTDTAKVAQRTYVYDDWGKLISGTDAGGFAGKDRVRWKGALWLGPEVDVYAMRARWYEAGSGRFISEDPIGLDGGLNPYVFAGSEPINGSDASGLDRCTVNGVILNISVEECRKRGGSLGQPIAGQNINAPQTPWDPTYGWTNNFLNPCTRGGWCGSDWRFQYAGNSLQGAQWTGIIVKGPAFRYCQAERPEFNGKFGNVSGAGGRGYGGFLSGAALYVGSVRLTRMSDPFIRWSPLVGNQTFAHYMGSAYLKQHLPIRSNRNETYTIAGTVNCATESGFFLGVER